MKKQDILEEVVNYAYLSIGSNIGNKLSNLQRTKSLIFENNINILFSSSYYETPSWPNPSLPRFINIVIKVSTKQDLKKIFSEFKKNRKENGQKKQYKKFTENL